MKFRFLGLPLIFSAVFFSACNSTSTNQSRSIDKSTIGKGGEMGATGFYVASFSPNEEVPSSVKFPSIQIQFSQPVVALEKLGEPITKTGVASIYPELNGVFRWYGTSLLSFDCTDDLIPQKEYFVTVNPDLVSANGEVLCGQNVFSFHTEELKLSSIELNYNPKAEKRIYINQNDVAPEYAKKIALTFSNKVNPSVVSKFLTVSDKSTEYEFDASKIDDKRILLSLKNDLPKNTDVRITLKDGAVPDENCWATSGEQIKSFHTLLPFEYFNCSGKEGLTLSFNHKIKKDIEQKIADEIKFTPEMKITKEQVHINGNTIFISDLPVTYGDSYSFKLDSGVVQDAFGQTCSNKISEKVQVPEADSFANYRDSSFFILESQFEPKRAFEFQNSTAEYSITPLYGISEKSSGKKQTFKIKTSEENRRMIQTIDLKNFLQKTGNSYRGSLKIDYAPNDNRTKRTSYIQVTDLGVTVVNSWNKTDVMVASLETGLPVSGATVNIYRRENNYSANYEQMILGEGKVVGTGKTDSQGLAVLTYDSDTKNANYYVEVKTDNDRVVNSISYISENAHKAAVWENGKIISLADKKELDSESIVGGRMVTKIFSDRGLYKPGETAEFKIIDRTLSLGQYKNYTGKYEASIVDGNYWRNDRKVYKKISGTLSDFGTADFEWTLPEDLKPGNYFIEYKRLDGKNSTAYESIAVQFFERVRFQASAQIPQATYFRGDALGATVTASYLGGGSLAGGSVRADWTRSETNFYLSDKKFKGYTFGPLSYMWSFARQASKGIYETEIVDYEEEYFHESSTQNLSAEGVAKVSVTTGSEKKDGAPFVYNLNASVTDAGNQMIGAYASAIVHPASFYIGLSDAKNLKGFAKKGEKLDFDLALVTPEGNVPDSKSLKDNKISWELLREYWEEVISEDEFGFEVSNWENKIVTEKTGTATVNSEKNGSLSFTPSDGGTYLLRLKSEDSQGRAVVTEKTFYVTGSSMYNRNFDGIQIELNPDKTEYTVGDTAHVLLKSSLDKGRYLLTLEREGIIEEKILDIKEPSSVIDVEIKEDFVPVVWIGLSTFTPRDGDPAADYDSVDSHKPKSVYASTMLNISKKSRTFDVDVKMDKSSYLPGGKVKIDLSATKNGKAVSNAELTLMVVDRGVLDLIGYKVGSPVENFYSIGNFNNRASYVDSRNNLGVPVVFDNYSMAAKERFMYVLRKEAMANGIMYDQAKAVSTASMRASEAFDDAYWDEECEMEEAMNDMDSGMEDGIQIRKDFRATAVFLPNLVTDAKGNVSAEFKLPDSLTEYVVTVVGVKENDFAYTEESLTVANPISVRDVETRLLRVGDNGEAGVVITNIGDDDENVVIDFEVLSGLDKTDYVHHEGEIIRQNGFAKVSGESQKSIVVKSGDTKTLMFRLDAVTDGWITLAFTVKSKSVNEKIYKALEIEKPYIYETVTTVGQLNQDEKLADEKIIFPSATDDGRGTLFVQLDSSRLGTLRSAVNYVFHYPYGCMEQRSSAIMPLVAFGDYIGVLGLSSNVDNAASVAKSEIASWANVQRKDGGFPYWPDSNESSFGVSLRIGEIIALAKEHKISVSSGINISKLVSYIKSELKKIEKEGYSYPKAYSYYVLSRLGEKISKSDLSGIINSNCGASEYAFAGLAAVENGYDDLAKTAVTKIKNLMSLTTRGASFQNDTNWCGWYFFNGDAERYALALHLFTKVDSEDLYNGHLVWQILELEKAGQGRWQSTATTSRVLIALDSYIRANNLTKTDFSAEILVNGKSVLSGDFKGLGAQPVDSTYRFGDFNSKSKLKDEKFSADLPKLDVPLDTTVPMEIKKDGDGLLFYTASMTYALPAAEQKARDEGLCVYVEITNARTGEKVDGDKLVSGEIYREKVYVTTTKNRTFVAVRAPVPAGAEILNPAFATTVTVVPDKLEESNSGYRPYNYWSISHQDIYDAEIRCFWNNLRIGSQSFEFLFRAQRSGEYESPAVLAECMYEPEIFGRSNGKRWTIE